MSVSYDTEEDADDDYFEPFDIHVVENSFKKPPSTERIEALVVCGPSGTGKTTLIRALQAEHPGEYRFSVSHTTRAPREGEKDGVDYHFVSEAEFERVSFIERSQFAGKRYGTSRGELAAGGGENACTVFDLNLEGVVNAKKAGIRGFYLLVLPPDSSELRRRLEGRGPILASVLAARMREAGDLAKQKDRVSWDGVLLNDDLDTAVSDLKKFLGK